MNKVQIQCENPIFIVGCPRSGTTVLASLLNRHPNIASGTETHFFNYVAKNNYNWAHFDSESLSRLLEESRVVDFIKLAELSKQEILNKFKNYDLSNIDSNLSYEEQSKKIIFNILMQSFLEHKHKSRFCEKTPNHLQNVPEILKLYPQAKIIHLVRDGRDTVNSLLKMPWRPSGLVNNARFWSQYIKLGSRIETKLKDHHQNNLLQIRYESLLENPEITLKIICKFIGEDFNQKILDDSNEDENIFSSWENSWKHKSRESLDSSRVGASIKELSSDDQAILNYLLRKDLIQLGYTTLEPKLNLKQYVKMISEYFFIIWRKIIRTIFNIIN